MPSLYGLIGYPLTHSFSPAYFRQKFIAQHIHAVYELFPIDDIDKLPSLIKQHPHLAGLNVTIPYKEAVMDYLQAIDDTALHIGAVNCIAFKDGIAKGYNTDALGFELSLRPLLQPQHTQALILGTGGASKAVAYALQQLGITFIKVSRHSSPGVITYAEITSGVIDRHKLIINTTPLGMHPQLIASPAIPYTLLGKQHLLYDLIYNPEQTGFLTQGKHNGAAIKNGLEMLQLQAEASWEIWNK